MHTFTLCQHACVRMNPRVYPLKYHSSCVPYCTSCLLMWGFNDPEFIMWALVTHNGHGYYAGRFGLYSNMKPIWMCIAMVVLLSLNVSVLF